MWASTNFHEKQEQWRDVQKVAEQNRLTSLLNSTTHLKVEVSSAELYYVEELKLDQRVWKEREENEEDELMSFFPCPPRNDESRCT